MISEQISESGLHELAKINPENRDIDKFKPGSRSMNPIMHILMTVISGLRTYWHWRL